jgi:hypothetical protein
MRMRMRMRINKKESAPTLSESFHGQQKLVNLDAKI